VAQAERQTALSKLNQVKANGAVRTAYAALLGAVGLSADTKVIIGETAGQPMPALSDETMDQYVQKALAGRPDVRAAEEKVKAAQGEVQSAHAAYRPVVSFAARYYQNIGALSTDGSPYYSVNRPGGAVFLNVELPLFDGGARSAHLSMAQSQVQAAEDQLEQVRDKAAQDVVKAYNDLRTGLEAYTEARAFSHAAKVAYAAALDAYRHGVGTYTDLASDETAMVQSDAALATADAEVRIARMALALAAGEIR
jgi:outer membrane protein TolC